MTKHDCVFFAAIFILFGGGCSKVSSHYAVISPTNNSDFRLPEFAQQQGDEKNGAPDGVLSESGMKPFSWPKRLTSLPLEERIRYRNTDCFVDALSEDILGDKETFIHVKRGEELIGRIWLPDCGQFGILDMDTPLPVLDSWSERSDGLICRSLLVPTRDGGRLHYGGCYTEVYTSNKARALLPEAYEVRLRPKSETMTVYFLGRLKTTTTMDAEQGLREALTIQ